MRPLVIAAASAALLLPSSLWGQTVQKVDVGGYGLEALVQGTGGPTVVFESDVGTPLGIWNRVQPLVSEFSTTVAYSRVGLGGSDAASTPRSPRQAVEELRLLLEGLGHSPPYILVGHAFGGLLSRVFYYEYPEEVAGLVLVNDTDERLFREWQATQPSWTPPGSSLSGAAAQAEVAMLRQIMEAGTLPKSRPLSGMPVYILTRGTPSGSFPGDALGLGVVRRLHAERFAGVTDGAHVIARRSNNRIHIVEPDLVAWSIRRVFDALQPPARE